MIHVHIQKIYHTTPYWVSFAQIYFQKFCLAAGLVWLISWESLVFNLWKVFNTLRIVSFKGKMAAVGQSKSICLPTLCFVTRSLSVAISACWSGGRCLFQLFESQHNKATTTKQYTRVSQQREMKKLVCGEPECCENGEQPHFIYDLCPRSSDHLLSTVEFE